VVKVMQCSCTHSYQDMVYGNNMRVFNKKKQSAGSSKSTWVCTVCRAELTTQEKATEEESKDKKPAKSGSDSK
jgi:hypothetical protein